jgi:uncharacterized membrane protein HdeD (DUF308 family)
MESEKHEKTFLKMREESDLSLEVVILLLLGMFTLIFAILLTKIHTGAFHYTPDSTYGLFLVIVSFQIVTMGKTPFGDLRRSWLLIIIGIITAILGMAACFIPGIISEIVRILVGILLLGGGISLISQLYISKDKAKSWLKNQGILQQLTIACTYVYIMMIVLGIITLLPYITTDYLTAVFLAMYSIGIFYLAWCLQKLVKLQVNEEKKDETPGIDINVNGHFKLLKDASIPVSIATILMIGTLITFLGLILFPVTTGMLPFSSDGELGVLLVINAIQMMALGETPLGEFKRSWLMVIIGLIFASFGIFSCIVPGIFTGYIIILIAMLNIIGWSILIIKRFMPVVTAMKNPAVNEVKIPSIVKRLMISQTLLNTASIAFGVSMLIPGIIPGMVIAGILVVNGLLFFVVVSYVQKLMHYGADEIPTAG